jgi:AcrR family transcriptional regulator
MLYVSTGIDYADAITQIKTMRVHPMEPVIRHKTSYIHTRDRILDAAEHLITEKGVFGFSLKDLAGPVGIRVPSIYKHFKNKDDVLIDVSRRFIDLLADQFQYDDSLGANESLQLSLQKFIEFNIEHPAFVRLALVDFATPRGGMEYVVRAAGGDFLENLTSGPLAKMHTRLGELLNRGYAEGLFRQVEALDFYKTIYASLLLQLVFPDDRYLVNGYPPDKMQWLMDFICDLAQRYLKK